MKLKTVLLCIGLVLGQWGALALKVLELLPSWSWWEATSPLWGMGLVGVLIAFCLLCERGFRHLDKVTA